MHYLRTMYEAAGKGEGWAERVDYTLLGFDRRQDLVNLFAQTRARSEQAIEALKGNQIERALMAAREVQSQAGMVMRLIRLLSKLEL